VVERDYRAGAVGVRDFCRFYIGTLAGRSAADWQPWRERFWRERVAPRVRPGTVALLQQHRDAGDVLLLSTATNRYLTELTAAGLGFVHLLATECEVLADGRFGGEPTGTLNMREGKVTRLREWLADPSSAMAGLRTMFYSDSINDLPLLEAVDEPVVTHGDARLLAVAAERGWRTLELGRYGHGACLRRGTQGEAERRAAAGAHPQPCLRRR
jgi:HAD superfamily hydrolase (TIGR01490 family)